MTRVAILWHMHQPYYEDLATSEHVLPWVRMHGLKDYYGMVALAREYPDVRMTFNLVPSLLVQLEAFAADRARDWHLALGLKPIEALTAHDRATMLAEFFHAPHHRMINLYPRYAELLKERDRGGGYTDADFLDLQVWHKLAWVDPFYLDSDPRVRRLLEKHRNFSEDDKRELREVELDILQRVIPEYRAAAARGQVELSTSPFYHPILPLLCDTDIYLRTHSTAMVPRPPFRRPEDAAEQLARARQCHLRLFDREPRGLWPSEGSVSQAALELAAKAGFTWIGTDEAILARTIDRDFRRDGQGRLENPDALYRGWSAQTGTGPIACLFRDHALSDRIGFVYASWDPEHAASDFVHRLVEGGRRFSSTTGGEEAVIPVILDGENAWEYFEGGGRPFLRALYAQLSHHPELSTVTMSEAAALPVQPLPEIFPGSWIDANFYIWIGHADDQRAWRQLRDARDVFERVAPNIAAPDREHAYEELLVAEGSDWFWWYGDDHSSSHDLEFDDLFRRHLRNVYQMLGQAVPDELFVTNISTSQVPLAAPQPVGLIRPQLDGTVSSYFEWLPAGSVETTSPSGAMTTAQKTQPVLRELRFGFDLEQLYLRLDFAATASQVLADGLTCSIHFATPADRRLVLSARGSSLHHRKADGAWVAESPDSSHAVAGDILEASLPFSSIGLSPGQPFSFTVSLERNGSELERHPEHRPVESQVPQADFELVHWKV